MYSLSNFLRRPPGLAKFEFEATATAGNQCGTVDIAARAHGQTRHKLGTANCRRPQLAPSLPTLAHSLFAERRTTA